MQSRRGEERERLAHWKPGGQARLRLAELMAELERCAEEASSRYADRVRAILTPEEYLAVAEAWQAKREIPLEIARKLHNDAEAVAAFDEAWHICWSLDAARQNSVISEHYVYRETGRTKLPKGWIV